MVCVVNSKEQHGIDLLTDVNISIKNKKGVNIVKYISHCLSLSYEWPCYWNRKVFEKGL